tara:strand:+ start:2767 stop:3489 length:723 start_codon:yes stop_codon:yes gene_type:complete
MDDFSEMLNGGDDFGDYTSNYEAMEVAAAEQTIRKKCKTFLRSMASVYGDITELPNSEELNINLDKKRKAFLQQAEIESVPLESILFQVSVGKHVLKTLVGHLNNGGSVDESLFDRIFKAQTSLMNITNTLAKYIRSLPTFFSQLAEEMRIQEQEISEMASFDDVTVVSESEVKSIGVGTPQDEIPYMGHGEILRVLQEQKDALENDFSSIENIDTTREGNLGNNPLRGGGGKLDIDDIV